MRRPCLSTVWSFAMLSASLLSGCGGGPIAPTPVTPSELAAAPTTVTAAGKSLTLGTYLWRDFQPISPPDGKPLAAVLHVTTGDGSDVPATLRADMVWVLYGTEIWTAVPEERPRSETAPVYEAAAHDGPKWGPGANVDVVVRLRDANGRTLLLRAPDQPIRTTF